MQSSQLNDQQKQHLASLVAHQSGNVLSPTSVLHRHTPIFSSLASQLRIIPVVEPTVSVKHPLLDPLQLNNILEFHLPHGRANYITLPTPSRETKTDPISHSNSLIKHAQPHLIVIRHKKMKKHKLRKLRKRMMFVFRKKAMAKRKIKEKAMLDLEKQSLKKAESFDPENFVNERLVQAREGGWHVDPFATWQRKNS